MTTLTLIGYWSSERHPDWPDPNQFVDSTWDEHERHMVWAYLSFGTVLRAGGGYSPCRFCGQANGSVEYTDGVYVWPEGLAHYVHDHGVRLPSAVVAHAMARLDDLEGSNVDIEWWRSQERP